MYTLKAVSELTGLSPETLRAWERRYQAVSPQRDKNKRRIYSTDDVNRLRLLSEACRKGHAISKLVALADSELALLARNGSGLEGNSPSFAYPLMDALERYRGDLCDEILGLAAATLSPAELVEAVLEPMLQEVGRRCDEGEIGIAQERLFSSCVERILMSLIHIYQKCAAGPGILLTTFREDGYRLGILLLAFVAASHRFRCHYFGPDLPEDEIAVAAAKTGAGVVAISMSATAEIENRLARLAWLSERLGEACELWIGGPGTLALPPERLAERCHCIRDMDDFQNRLRLLGIRR